MSIFVKELASDSNVALLLEAAPKVDPEWITIILLAYKAGIKAGKARHLGQAQLIGETEIELEQRTSECKITRKLPPEVRDHLAALPKNRKYFCPTLQAMTTERFLNEWRRLCRRAKFIIQTAPLIWAYRDKHRTELNWERAQGYLNKLAGDCLTKSEFEKLRNDAESWARMPAKKTNRARLKTRSQLLLAGK